MSEFYRYRILAAEVVNGDTVDLELDVGFRHTLRDRFRLFGPDPDAGIGLNAPERNTPEGKAAKAFLEDLLKRLCESERVLIAHTVKDKREKYGRWLVVIREADSTLNVNLELIAAGHARLQAY